MGYSPHTVSNQRKGSRFPARPLNQPRGFEPGTSCFRGGRFDYCATWTPCAFYYIITFIDTFTGLLTATPLKSVEDTPLGAREAAEAFIREVVRYRGDYTLFVPSAVRITS